MQIFSTIMEWYFTSLAQPYGKNITGLSEQVVRSTIETYNSIQVNKDLLPTPAKSHYIYNLRDISKVFQGIIKANAKGIRDENSFIRLWLHETMRVFKDRLINTEDQQSFDNMLKQILQLNFKRDWASLVTVEPLLFAAFVPLLYPEGDTSRKPMRDVYCELTDRDAVRKKCDRYL
jgi:dynein heavy chain